MTCAEARDLMLEADPAELVGGGGSPLAAHLQECPACRTTAARLVDAQRTLAAALGGARPRRPPDEALRVAAHSSHRRWVWRATPLAAAAVLAALLVSRRPPTDRVSPNPSPPFRGVTVEPPRGRSVAIMRADNPNLVIIWFF